MFDLANVPPVVDDESVARYIIFSGHIRSSDQTVKPDAFMPHPHTELSLTRHREATEQEIWQEGQRVATMRQRTLYGRADVEVVQFTAEQVKVVARPIDINPNHADAIDWPAEKPHQKMKALLIANQSQFIEVPRSVSSAT